jgi:hypothetical protein
MPESVTVSLTGDSDAAADLVAWLRGDDELRGYVRPLPAAVPPGKLGAELTQLLVEVGSGGMATAFASVLIAWIRRRTGGVSLSVKRPDGTEFTLTAERVAALDARELQEQAAQLAALAWPAQPAIAQDKISPNEPA